VGERETRLVSHKGNVYKGLSSEAVLDGEIVILDAEGRPLFYELFLRRGRGETVFYAFDLLWLDWGGSA
jgi:ATP-dependent DNA ligase